MSRHVIFWQRDATCRARLRLSVTLQNGTAKADFEEVEHVGGNGSRPGYHYANTTAQDGPKFVANQVVIQRVLIRAIVLQIVQLLVYCSLG